MGGAGTRYVGLGSMHVRMCGVCLLYTSTLLCVAACVQNVFAKNVFDVEPLPPVCRFCVTVTKKKDRGGTTNSRVGRWRRERQMGRLLSGTQRQWERGGEGERKRGQGAGGERAREAHRRAGRKESLVNREHCHVRRA